MEEPVCFRPAGVEKGSEFTGNLGFENLAEAPFAGVIDAVCGNDVSDKARRPSVFNFDAHGALTCETCMMEGCTQRIKSKPDGLHCSEADFIDRGLNNGAASALPETAYIADTTEALMAAPISFTLSHEPSRQRYVLSDDAGPVAFASYAERGGRLHIHHTEVDRARRGQGIGGELVRQVLDRLRAEGRTVVPACPFVRNYIAGHPEYRNILQ